MGIPRSWPPCMKKPMPKKKMLKARIRRSCIRGPWTGVASSGLLGWEPLEVGEPFWGGVEGGLRLRGLGVDMLAVDVGCVVFESYSGIDAIVCLAFRYRFVIVRAVRTVITNKVFNM